jgi:hypothetical protein
MTFQWLALLIYRPVLVRIVCGHIDRETPFSPDNYKQHRASLHVR